MKRIIVKILTLLLLITYSCREEDIYIDQNKFGSKVEQSGSSFKSTFHIKNDIATFSENITLLKAKLTSHSDNNITSDIKTAIEHFEDKHRLTMYFSKRIADGDYTLHLEIYNDAKSRSSTIEQDNVNEYNFHVTFEGMMVSSVSLECVPQTDLYNLKKGSGTKDDPFIIYSTEDFDKFKHGLSKDSIQHGKGLFFKQITSFESPRVSDSNDGKYSSCYDFAGVYDGGGNTISDVIYLGGDGVRDNQGLFSVLRDGAKISNLNIKFAFHDTGSSVGGLAGKCVGTVEVEDVFVKGVISNAKDNVGGLIGEVSSSSLSVKNCRMEGIIEGRSNLGGLLGSVDKSEIDIKGVYNKDNIVASTSTLVTLDASGGFLGGIIGKITSSKFDIEYLQLKGTISEDDTMVEHIHSEKGDTGGLIGFISDIVEGSSLKNIWIQTPVHSEENNVGGLIGSYQGGLNGAQLVIENVSFASYVKGGNNVGGFIGSASSASDLIFNGGNKISQIRNGYLKVEGGDNVGGVIGNAQGNISFAGDFTINIDIDATSDVGGCVGSYYNGTLDLKNFIPSEYMTVEGASSIGGIVGQLLESGHIKGTTPSIEDMTKEKGTIPAGKTFESYSNFSGKVIASKDRAGGIVGSIRSKGCSLENLTFTGSVFSEYQLGGILGLVSNSYARPRVFNCVNLSDELKGKENSLLGGIVGELYLGYINIEYCSNYANINSEGDAVAGIIARVSSYASINISNAVNVGDIEGTGIVAGVFARVIGDDYSETALNISESANYGAITSNNGECAAGILGKAIKENIKISACANHGDIHAEKASRVGGVAAYIGANSGWSAVKNVMLTTSCNKGDISSGEKDAYIAGLIGQQGDGNWDYPEWGTYDCYNTGAIKTDHSADTGGILGYAEDQTFIQRCINIGEVSYGNGTIGTHRWGSDQHEGDLYFLKGTGKDWCGHEFKESDRKNSGTFENFDFDKVWAIDSDDKMNGGYPFLRNCKYQNMSVEE